MANTKINECEYYYKIEGQGPEPIFFAHGLLLNHYSYHHQVEYFKSKYQTVVFDERGHGKTELTESGYDLDDLTNSPYALKVA